MSLSNSFTKNVSKADKVKCKSSCALIVIMQSGSLVHDQITTYSQTWHLARFSLGAKVGFSSYLHDFTHFT